ncbi:MAG: TetR family transcriptional regulator C-terminal domain-containing protein [Rhodocyclaceae bacterium]
MTSPAVLPRRPRGRPSRNGQDYADTRALLIRSGLEHLTCHGVSATVIDDVLKQVNVPKGSFYHYFASKEAFVEAVIDAYAEYFDRKLSRVLGDTTLAPLARLRAFVDEACEGVARHDFMRGCLVGNLGQEVCSLPPAMRERLEAIFGDWERHLAGCLEAAAVAGEIAPTAPFALLAHTFWVGWEGAVLRARLARSTLPMTRFLDLFLQALPRA